jgi:hypothetical protein
MLFCFTGGIARFAKLIYRYKVEKASIGIVDTEDKIIIDPIE